MKPKICFNGNNSVVYTNDHIQSDEIQSLDKHNKAKINESRKEQNNDKQKLLL